jgi:hypothetical protein
MSKPKPAPKTRPDSYCQNPQCGKRISAGRHGRRKYCNQACKQAAYRNRNFVTPAIGKRNKTVTGQAAQV